MRAGLLATTALAFGLCGCSFMPDYKQPPVPVSSSYLSFDQPPSGTTAADVGWRDFFADPVMQDLIAMSLKSNRDLRVAGLNVAAAQAQYRYDRASLFPTIDGQASITRSSTPGDIDGATEPQNVKEYSLGLSAVSWELDLFGKIRSQAEAQHQTYLADDETRLSTQISLIAQVASGYLAWLADRDAVAAQADQVRLSQMMRAHGSATAIDLAQAQTTLHSVEVNVALYSRQVAQDMDSLVLLLGAPIPTALEARMEAAPGLDAVPRMPALSAGLPADLLQRRPDIRSAEHQLRAANADIGAARAAFFPSVSLTASGGTASRALSNLFRASWSFEPQISVPIFDAGANFANLDQAEVQQHIDLADYEKTIQSAFHDVLDALDARSTYVDQVKAQKALTDSDQRYYDLAVMRFKAGVDTYLNALVADAALLNARLDLISVKLSALQNEITLYKALGGGWQATGGATARDRSQQGREG